MNRIVRRRIEMFKRVRSLSEANPSADAGYAVVMEGLDHGIIRLDAMAHQQEESLRSSRSSTVRRQETRRRLHTELLPHLVTVAEAASAEDPSLTERCRLPQVNLSHEAYRTAARDLLELGRAHAPLLVKHGLTATLLDDLDTALAGFDASVAMSSDSRRGHVGARAELDALSDELMKLVERLDGLNRYRFAGNAELMAAWASARRVVHGPRTQDEGQQPAGPGSADGVRPAA
jgi:hypothetical protein